MSPHTISRRLILFALLTLPACAQLRVNSVTNSAGFVPGLPGYGGLATLFVDGLTGVQGVVTVTSFPLPTQLLGVSVLFGGVAAPILGLASLNGYQQVNVQVPYEAASFAITLVQNNAQAPVFMPLFDNAPGEFFADAGGRAIVQHAADFSLVTTAHPAARGETLVAYSSGLGAVSPAIVSGVPAPAAPLEQALIFLDTAHDTFTLRVGGVSTSPQFAGLTPGLAGHYQINFTVPATAPSGDQDMAMVLIVCPTGCGGTPPSTLTSKTVKLAVQ